MNQNINTILTRNIAQLLDRFQVFRLCGI